MDTYSPKFFQKIIDTVPITDQCHQQFQKFISNLNTENSWSQSMVDAYSQIPTGRVTLKFDDLGDFQKCINTEASYSTGDIFGKYCLGFIATTNKTNKIRDYTEVVPPVWSLCVPHGCTAQDTNAIGSSILTNLTGVAGISVNFPDFLCQTSKEANPVLSTGAIAAITVLAALLFLVFLSTLYDIYIKFTKSTRTCPLVLQAFSLYTNCHKIFKPAKTNPNHLPCLDGLRFFSMLWVVLLHQYMTLTDDFLTNPQDLVVWAKKLPSMVVISGTLSVDTFFTIGGVLLSYGFMKERMKKVPFDLFWYYFHRYIRLSAALVLMVLFCANLLVYMGSGPRWPLLVAHLQTTCVDYWWSTLLHVQNYVNNLEMCLVHTWYLNVDFQLYIISPLVLFGLWKYPKLCLAFLGFCILASLGTVLYTVWSKSLPAIALLPFRRHNWVEFLTQYYFWTHTRMPPWIVGVVLGFFIFKIRQRVLVFAPNKYTLTCMWFLCLGTLLGCVFWGYEIFAQHSEDYSVWSSCVYLALVRLVWSLAICWIILTSSTDCGGPISWVLSFPIYQVFNRFTYSTYLTHLIVLQCIHHNRKRSYDFNGLTMYYEFWGTLAFSVGLAAFLIFMAECPSVVLEKMLQEKLKNRGNASNKKIRNDR